MPNKLMAFFLISISLWLIDNFMRISGIFQNHPDLYFKPIYYSLAFGPLIYFYVVSITNSNFKFKKVHLLHFIPVIFQGGLYLFLSLKDYSFKRWYWIDVHLPYTYRLEFDGTFISMAIYLFFALKVLAKYQDRLNNNYSETAQSRLNWLKLILVLMLLLSLQWFVEVILRDFYENYYNHNYSIYMLGIVTLIFAFRAFYQADQQAIVFEEKSNENINLDSWTFDENILNKIQNRMIEHKDYLDPKLSLKTFASNCKLPQKTVSQYLNQKLDQTFHDYVNRYRVEAFKTKLETADREIKTFEGLAYESGFNSKASFNRIFKKFTGMTPTQFVSK